MKNSTAHDYRYESLHRYARQLGYGTIHQRIDKKTGLNAIIAVHDTTLGPALGGCRLYSYPSISFAIKDVLRLGQMMTLKSAFHDVPHGGAKAVLLKPKYIGNRKDYFSAFGDFVHELQGKYITAVDVGTSTEDMDIIAERTPYVIGASRFHQHERDPSPSTARGVLLGIEAAVQFHLNKADLQGLHVVIQGIGHVGYHLAKMLHQRGAHLTLSDIKQDDLHILAKELDANVVSPNAVYEVPCDVFSPCAMGGIINAKTLPLFKTQIIAGSANNQLAHHQFGSLLHKKGILYAPDFVINAGGLISAAMDYTYRDPLVGDELITKMYSHMLNLYERSQYEQVSTLKMAETIAMEKLLRR